MKFFTIDWWSGQADDHVGAEEAIKKYSRHLEKIRSKLPSTYFELEKQVHLHDSRFRGLKVRDQSDTATLSLSSIGGFEATHGERRRVSLIYTGNVSAEIKYLPDKALGAAELFGDLGYDELDLLADGRFEHRILFSSAIEIHIAFRNLEFNVGDVEPSAGPDATSYKKLN